MNYLNDIVNKYRTCKKCGIQKQQLEMCLDVHKNKVNFDSDDWYCEKCYAEVYKKQDGDRMESVEDPGKVILDPDYMTLEEAQNIILLTIHEDNDEAQIAYDVIDNALRELVAVKKALGNELKQIVEEYWSFDGSIQEVIRMFLKSNPNYKVAHLQLTTTQQHGAYALVVYEYIGS